MRDWLKVVVGTAAMASWVMASWGVAAGGNCANQRATRVSCDTCLPQWIGTGLCVELGACQQVQAGAYIYCCDTICASCDPYTVPERLVITRVWAGACGHQPLDNGCSCLCTPTPYVNYIPTTTLYETHQCPQCGPDSYAALESPAEKKPHDYLGVVHSTPRGIVAGTWMRRHGMCLTALN